MGKGIWSGIPHLVRYELRGVSLFQHTLTLVPFARPSEDSTNFASVLTKPKHIQAVFSDSDKHYKAVNNNAGYIMGQLLGKCVGLINGREWRASRTVTEVPFVHYNVAQYVPIIRRHVETYMTKLESSKNLQEGFLHPAEDLKFLPFWMIAEIFYGELPLQLSDWLKCLIPLREGLFKGV